MMRPRFAATLFLPRLHLTVLLSSLAWMATANADEANLLRNGCFTPMGDTPSFDSWRIPKADQKIAYDTAQSPANGCKGSLRVDVGATHRNWGEAAQSLRGLKNDTTYRLAGWVKSSLQQLGVLQVKLYRDGKELKRLNSARSTTEWQEIALEFNTLDADKVEILCRWAQDKPEAIGQSVWFANLSLAEVGPPKLLGAEAVGTFHSLGVTVKYDGGFGPHHVASVRYRARGQAQWHSGMDLVAYPPEKELRGSLFDLEPATEYEIACGIFRKSDTQTPLDSQQTTGRTWSETVPIAEVRHLPAGVSQQPLVIDAVGKPDGWILYAPPEGKTSTIDAGTSADYAVLFENAAYVVLQNATVRGGKKHAVNVVRSHHVRVRRCDIAGWGDPGTRRDDLKMGLYVDERGRLINYQAGVCVGDESSQVCVEDNFIHHPRGTANSWKYGHPAGPQGIILAKTGGNNVIRNNEIIGSETHWWNDAIESIRNSDVGGGPYRDTDFYGNTLAFSNDDGTELDGGQINVRYFNNWIDKALCGVSCAPNRRGPSYVFRNLIVLTGEEFFRTGAGFKMGGNRFPAPGLSLLLHNTIYSNGHGLTAGHYGKGPTPILTRNNVFFGPSVGCGAIRYRYTSDVDFDYDLIPPHGTQIAATGQETHAVKGYPKVENAAAGDYRLLPDSPGVDAGQRLPGINDGFTGPGPDLGAFERRPDSNVAFPHRENALSALPLRVAFDHLPEKGPSQGEIRLLAPTSTGTRWTTHPNSPWLRCEPSSGTCQDAPQTVRIMFAADTPEYRLHRGAVTFRTDEGLNRSVMVDIKVYPQPYVALAAEAEQGQIEGGMRVGEDAGASAIKYVD